MTIALVDQVIERGKAFADAGASGFFVPRLADPKQIERVVREVPLPLNVIAFPGAPDKKVWADAGVARISHGPFPHRALMAKLTEMAQRGDRLGAAEAATTRTARAGLQHGLAEQLGADAQDQRDPQGLPQDRDDMRPRFRLLRRRARASPSATTRGKPPRPAPAANPARRSRSRQSRRSAPGRTSPASTSSALRARSRPARRSSGTRAPNSR